MRSGRDELAPARRAASARAAPSGTARVTAAVRGANSGSSMISITDIFNKLGLNSRAQISRWLTGLSEPASTAAEEGS